MINQPIEVAKQKLGAPQQEELPPATGNSTAIPSPTAQSTWKSGDTTLTATWKTGNKRVTAWTIMRPDADAVREEEKAVLLKPGRLQENDTRYSVDWLEAPERPLFYSGARIVPIPKNHAVILRITGGSALLDVSYQITGGQNEAETFMTIAPWEKRVTLPDDAQIQIKVRTLKSAGGSTAIKAEILSDGKVAASANSNGTGIQCQLEL